MTVYNSVVGFITVIFISAVFTDSYSNQNEHIIVHLFEWKFNDIARECKEFLGPYGYSAVQISPVNEYAVLEGRPWYERYQPFSYELASRSGTVEEFKAMIKACNDANVKIYVDVVLNHMSATLPPNTKGTANHTALTSNKVYPAVPYTNQNFHKTCSIQNYQDAAQVRNCELVGLHDLDHSEPYVKTKVINFLNGLIELGVAGFRVDAAKHMWPDQLKQIYNSLNDLNVEAGFPKGSRPFIYQEVIDYGGEGVKFSEYTGMGHVTEFKFGKELSRSFRGQNLLKWFRNFGPEWNLMNSDYALVFVDNHDTQRAGDNTLNYKDSKQYKMAVGFMLSWPYGTKRVMSSYDFTNHDQGPPHNPDMSIKSVTTNPDMTCNDGWICEHRWRQIYNMVRFANAVKGTSVEHFWDNGSNQISYCRGNKGFVAFNLDNYDLNQKLMTCLPAGTYCDVISGNKIGNRCTGKTITVNADGTANISIGRNEEDGILALHVQAKL